MSIFIRHACSSQILSKYFSKSTKIVTNTKTTMLSNFDLNSQIYYFFQLRRDCFEGLLREVWERVVSSVPDHVEDEEDGNDGGEEEENTAQTEEAEGELSGHVSSKPPALKVCQFSYIIFHILATL